MTPEDILKTHGLKCTACRKHIVNDLLEEGVALSEEEFKSSLPDLFDRVTFYRTLKTLEENAVIHRVTLSDSSIKYALNREKLNEHDHAHFHCIDCDTVLCIEEEIETPTSIPGGYSINHTQILLEGTCPKCKTQR